MKVDIYIQRDSSALVVPSGCDLSKLPENARVMVLSSTGKKTGMDVALHLIALDEVNLVWDGINKDGYYVNRRGTDEHRLMKQLEEHDFKTEFTNTARRVPDTDVVKRNQ